MGFTQKGIQVLHTKDFGAAGLLRPKEKCKSLPPPRTEEETQRLLHELRVHQIELEAQNEELRVAQEGLEASRNDYQELYEFAPTAFFTFDLAGRVKASNLTGAELLGIERQVLVGIAFGALIANQEDRARFRYHLAEAAHSEHIQNCELRLTGKDGAVIHALLQSTRPDKGRNGNVFVFTSVTDVTVAKQLEHELQKAHDTLEMKVAERTGELSESISHLNQEIVERKKAEACLNGALQEINRLKDLLLEENIYLQKEIANEWNFGNIIGQSEALEQVFTKVNQVAPINATVLLLGETGTGKGLIARAIHARSTRKDRPMITVNCAALPANLFESELFGRERGAFTGANAQQMGRFELADGGTILLDEIGEMPLELQTKLLRILQDGEFERLGSPRTIKTDVRIIAATNRNLDQEIKNGKFREDLFYRLNVFPIVIPPLRQRKEDIPLLVSCFIDKYNKKTGKKIETISKETMNTLMDYSWPGNVRELESVIERAVITSPKCSLQVLDRFDSVKPLELFPEHESRALADLERDHILQVLLKTGWRIDGKNGAALLLDINPSTLRARMRKHGIHRA